MKGGVHGGEEEERVVLGAESIPTLVVRVLLELEPRMWQR